jgi:hypothetical protein
MTLTIDLPAALEQYLLQSAKEEGISLEAMTLRVLTNSIPMLDSSGSANDRKQAEALLIIEDKDLSAEFHRWEAASDEDEALIETMLINEGL